MWGKPRPDLVERNRKRTGKKHPCFGKKRPDVSDRLRKQVGEKHPQARAVLCIAPNGKEHKYGAGTVAAQEL